MVPSSYNIFGFESVFNFSEDEMMILRQEYPRPHFARATWQSLNGPWYFDFDDDDEGLSHDFHLETHHFSRTIIVPFAPQSVTGGINDENLHDVMWYQKKVTLNGNFENGRILLCFNAIDSEATIWVNGKFAAFHRNGYSSFESDISDYVNNGENTITIRVKDGYDTTQPRGKQFWKVKPEECWYTATSGIWQSVWLEKVGIDYLVGLRMTPDIDTNFVLFELETLGKAEEAEITVSFAGRPVKKITFTLDGKYTKQVINLKEENSVYEVHLWSPEHPNLYQVRICLKSAKNDLDVVNTYFGMRKISLDENQRICLNNIPLYQRLILDQGYFKDGDLTATSIDQFEKDIGLAKKMGFNGARKHQKIEDPYFYHYANKMGFLVWGEMPSTYEFNHNSVKNNFSQFIDLINQLYNHPSIICWVPVNESWGARKALVDKAQQSMIKSLYHLCKTLDQTRIVSANDGWENINETDFISIHDYAFSADGFEEKYKPENIQKLYPMSRKLMANGEIYRGQSMILTEFGGFAIKETMTKGLYSYGGVAKTDFVKHLEDFLNTIRRASFSGFVYTQLTDTKQEANGLLDAEHQPKIDISLLNEVFGK